MPFPAHQACDRIALFHARAFKEPKTGIGTGPIPSANAGGAPPHEQRRVRPRRVRGGGIAPLVQHIAEFLAKELVFAAHDPVGLPLGGRQQGHHAPNRVAAQEGEVDAGVAGPADVVEHLPRPILVMAHRDKSLCAL